MKDIMKPSDLTSLTTLAAESATSGDDTLLRLLRDGIWVYGSNNDEVEPGSQWAINPYSFQHGWICWGNSEVLGEVMVPHGQPLPPRSELPAHEYVDDNGNTREASWDDQLSFHLMCVYGVDKGLEVLYKATSYGGKKAVGAVARAIAGEASDGSLAVVPVVELNVDSYQHKKWGKIYTPELDIVRWMTMDGLDAEEVEREKIEEESPEPEKKPRRRRARA